MPDYQATLQLSRKHSLYCVLGKAWVEQQPRSLCGHGSSSVVFPLQGQLTVLREGHCSEIYLSCFIAVVFFISEIVLFNILNKILRNKW